MKPNPTNESRLPKMTLREDISKPADIPSYGPGVVPFMKPVMSVTAGSVTYCFREPLRGDIKTAMADTQKEGIWSDTLVEVCLENAYADGNSILAKFDRGWFGDLSFTNSLPIYDLFNKYFKIYTIDSNPSKMDDFFINGTESVTLEKQVLQVEEPTQRTIRNALQLLQLGGQQIELDLPDFLFEHCCPKLQELAGDATVAHYLNSLTWAQSFEYQSFFQRYLANIQKKLRV